MTTDEIKEGYYRGRAIAGSAQFGNDKNGAEQVSLALDVPSLGRSFTTVLSFAGNAGPYSLQRLQTCGWKGGTDKSLPGIDANEIDVSLKYETYVDRNGETQRTLRAEIATGGFSFKQPMNEKQVGGFLAELTKKMQNGAAPGTKAAPPPRSQVDDDIPF